MAMTTFEQIAINIRPRLLELCERFLTVRQSQPDVPSCGRGQILNPPHPHHRPHPCPFQFPPRRVPVALHRPCGRQVPHPRRVAPHPQLQIWKEEIPEIKFMSIRGHSWSFVFFFLTYNNHECPRMFMIFLSLHVRREFSMKSRCCSDSSYSGKKCGSSRR